MNDDLISRGALLKDIDFDREAAKVHPQEICERFNRFCDYAEELVKGAHAVDAVEVVMCKDCIAFGKSPYGHPGLGWCRIYGHHFKPDYYCASGKRVEG